MPGLADLMEQFRPPRIDFPRCGGFPRDPAETVEEYAGRLGEGKPGARASFATLAQNFVLVRYGNHAAADDTGMRVYRSFMAITESVNQVA